MSAALMGLLTHMKPASGFCFYLQALWSCEFGQHMDFAHMHFRPAAVHTWHRGYASAPHDQLHKEVSSLAAASNLQPIVSFDTWAWQKRHNTAVW